IISDVKFSQGDYYQNQSPQKNSSELQSLKDDSSVRSECSMDDLQAVPDVVDEGHTMETVPVEEVESGRDKEIEIESQAEIDHSVTSNTLEEANSDQGNESDAYLFIPQPQRYETHPNKYLPQYQVSETDADEERSKLLNSLEEIDLTASKVTPNGTLKHLYCLPYLPNDDSSYLKKSQNVKSCLPYLVNKTNKISNSDHLISEYVGGMKLLSGSENEDVSSLWGISCAVASSNASHSDLDYVCDIEDSEVNPEFENDEKTRV
ncbi:unnamed protein product, partial [Meganyctiphanes norvegica]